MNLYINALRRISIFKRLLIAFVIVIIIPNLTLSLILYFKHSSEVKNSVEAQVKQFVLSTDQIIRINLEEYEALLFENLYDDSMSELLAKARLYEELYLYRDDAYATFFEYKMKIENRLYNFSPLNSKITSVQIVTPTQQYKQIDLYGNLKGGYFDDVNQFMTSNAYQSAIEAEGYPVWIDLSQNDSIIKKQNTNYYLEPSILLLRALRDNEGHNLGVIVLSISSSIFNDISISSELLDQGNLLLIGKQSVIRSINENVKVPTLNDEVYNKIRKKSFGWLESNAEGEKLSIYYHNLKIKDWYIVYNIPTKHLLESVNSTRRIVVIISVLVILVAGFIAFLVTKSISLPLAGLRRVISKLDYNSSKIITYDFMKHFGEEIYFNDMHNDEIAQLGLSYNLMVERLSELLLTLEHLERQKEKEIILRKEAELDALQMQINPHLLYNTLDIIRWEALRIEGDEKKISRMIMHLTQLLRLSIKRHPDLIPLSEEIDHVKAFVKVVNYKFENLFNVHYDINDYALMNYSIVKLIIQPLVENAILYGQKKEKSSIDVYIRVYEIEEKLIIEVEDNGVGIEKDKLIEIRATLEANERNSENLALKNIHDRITLNFGEKYGLIINSTKGKGAIIRICIPKIIYIHKE